MLQKNSGKRNKDNCSGKFLVLPIFALFVVCAIISIPAIAIAPKLDLDADNSIVVGAGYITTMKGAPVSITDDVVIKDSDSKKISRAVITITNPRPGDRLLRSRLKGQLDYDPSSTNTRLIVTGAGLLKKYEAALRSIAFFNGCTSDCDSSLRLVSIVIEDDHGEASNTAITAIEVKSADTPPSALRSFIYLTVQNALSLVTLEGAVVNVNESHDSLTVEETAGMYIMDINPDGVYTVNVALPGFDPASVNDVIADYANDPASPVQIYLDEILADADIVTDGLLNAGDYLVAIRIALGLKAATNEELSHGDMNGDGEITLSDLVLILQAIQTAP